MILSSFTSIDRKSLILLWTFLYFISSSFFVLPIQGEDQNVSTPQGLPGIQLKTISKIDDEFSKFESNYGGGNIQASTPSTQTRQSSSYLVNEINPQDGEDILRDLEANGQDVLDLSNSSDNLNISDLLEADSPQAAVPVASPSEKSKKSDGDTPDPGKEFVSQSEMNEVLITNLSRGNEYHILENSEYEDYVERAIADARLAAAQKDVQDAENSYLKVLTGALPNEKKRQILLEMGKLYRDNQRNGQAAAVYERFVNDYPQNERSPSIHLKLAELYRSFGANNSAINSYYDVINAALALPSDQDPMRYQQYSLKAQFGIAGTFLELSNTEILKKPEGYNETYLELADRYLDRLLRLPLDDKHRAIAVYRSAYAKYKKQSYPQVISLLKDYSVSFPESDLIPESYYLTAISHQELDQPKDALVSVIELLNFNQIKEISDPETWAYWKKKTGNQLANTFYVGGDFFNALELYKVLYKVDKDVTWQAGTLYQIGLCYERLGMFPKASEAYEILSEWSEWEGDEYETNENLALIRNMSNWRKDNLNWSRQADNYLNKITIPSLGDEI